MMKMKLADTIVYVLATAGHGMTTKQIALAINKDRLHIRKDGKPVNNKQIYAVVCRFPNIFIKESGRILLSM